MRARKLPLLFALIALIALPAPARAEPVLDFSDLVSGPKAGNSDTGQIAGTDGVIVTVWGTGLGDKQGQSTITANGAAAKIYYWGDALPPWSPADLHARHGMQEVIFQVSHLASDGPGSITAKVGGDTSNGLPFTVRAGNIHFVATTGNDTTGDGTWSTPWRGIPKAVSKMAAGDVTYVCDGVKQTSEDAYAAAVNLSLRGTAEKPAALVAYPGANVVIGADTIRRGFGNWLTDYGYTDYWVISKFSVRAHETAIALQTGFRVVGNFVTAPTGSAPEGAIEGNGNDLFVLGNELTHVGKAGADKLYHPIYISSQRADSGPRRPAEAGREIAWNYIHDNNANRGINIYSERASTAYMSGHRVHDNFIINQVGGGMLLGQYMTGDNWVYNNIIANAGLGPEPAEGLAQQHIGVEIQPGVADGPATTLYFYNNTIYGCGWKGASGPSATGNICFDRLNTYKLIFTNNIIVSTGQPYEAPRDGEPSPGAGHNLWFGAGAAPRWDSSAINADPQFLNAGIFDFHLQSHSPAIGKGFDVRTVAARDLDNNLRAQVCSLGAFEY